MKHRIYHSKDLHDRFADYALRVGTDSVTLKEAYDWMLAHDVAFEHRDQHGVRTYISLIDIEPRIEHPLARRFFALLKSEIPASFVPLYGFNFATIKDRFRRIWEQTYNILICKIPSHALRLAWLRLGGAKIGRGSTIWRNTEIIGMEGVRIGEDSVIGWHCQLDGRGGLTIGDHVTIASYSLFVTGRHDLHASEFWAIYTPITIDDYVWVTSRATLTGGAYLGRGSVVTPGTVVNRPVAPYKIVSGNAAEPIGERTHELSYRVGGKGLFTLLH